MYQVQYGYDGYFPAFEVPQFKYFTFIVCSNCGHTEEVSKILTGKE